MLEKNIQLKAQLEKRYHYFEKEIRKRDQFMDEEVKQRDFRMEGRAREKGSMYYDQVDMRKSM